jgi:hypothetical protein
VTFLVKIPFFANLMQHASRCIWVRNAFGTNIHTSYVVHISLAREVWYGTGTGMFVLYVGKRYSYGRFMSLGTLFLSYYSNLQHCCRLTYKKILIRKLYVPFSVVLIPTYIVAVENTKKLWACWKALIKSLLLSSTHRITNGSLPPTTFLYHLSLSKMKLFAAASK